MTEPSVSFQHKLVPALRSSLLQIVRGPAFKDTAIVLAGNGIAAGLGFVVAVILSRALGPARFGVISTAVAVTTIVTGLTDFGIGTGLVRIAGRDLETDRPKAKALLVASLKVELALGALILVVGMLFARPLAALLGGGEELVVPLELAFLAGFGLSVGAYNNALLQVYLKFNRLAMLIIVYGLAKLLVIGALWIEGRLSVEGVLVVYAILSIGNLGLGFWLIPHEELRGWRAVSGQRAALAELFHFSKWVMLSFIATSLLGRLDILMLSHFRGSEEVGLYAAAFQLATVFPLIIGAVSTTLLPRLSRAMGPGQLTRMVQKTLGISGVVALALLPVLLVSTELITGLFGQRYAAAIPTFQVLYVAFLLALLVNPIGMALYVLDRAWVLTAVNYAQLLLTFLLNLILVPAYGSVGAAMTFLASTALGFGLIGSAVWRGLRR